MSYDSSNEFLTVQEVSDMLRLNTLTIYKYIRDGSLNAHEFGGHYRIPKSSLQTFIENHKVANPSEEEKDEA